VIQLDITERHRRIRDVQQYHGTIGKNAILRNKKELELVFGIAMAGRKGGLNVSSLILP